MNTVITTGMTVKRKFWQITKKYSHQTDIAFFVPSLRGGGAERVMLTLAEGLAARGYAVDLVLVKAEGALMAHVPPTVRIVDLDAPRIIMSLPALVRYLRRVRPVAMLSALDSANCVAIWARSLSRISTRLVISVHNTLTAATESATTKRARLLPTLMRRAYRKADAVVAVSSGVADDLSEVIGMRRERITVAYNPVVTPQMLKRSQERPDHHWFAEGEPPVILGVGRLTKQKDFPTLLKAFALLRERQPARLIILGEGEERNALEELIRQLGIENDTALPGYVSNPYAYMRAAKLFVLSSRWEGLPTVLIEAMACGASVISTDCPSGPTEILENGRLGTLVPVGDINALAGAMSKAISTADQPDLQNRVQDFGLEETVNKYLQILKVG